MMPTTATAIAWKRAKRLTTEVGAARIWETRCGAYRVRESIIPGYPVKYYAQAWREDEQLPPRPADGAPLPGGYWDILSEHRSRAGAEKACERHVKGTD